MPLLCLRSGIIHREVFAHYRRFVQTSLSTCSAPTSCCQNASVSGAMRRNLMLRKFKIHEYTKYTYFMGHVCIFTKTMVCRQSQCDTYYLSETFRQYCAKSTRTTAVSHTLGLLIFTSRISSYCEMNSDARNPATRKITGDPPKDMYFAYSRILPSDSAFFVHSLDFSAPV